MICRLFELYSDTGIDVGKKEGCDPTCQDYINDNDNKCKICKNVEIKLTKQKYSWMISRLMNFNHIELLVDEDTAYQIIKLIHPSLSNIWIIRWASLDNKKNILDAFSIFVVNKEYNINNLYEVNIFLKTRCDYDGRNLTYKDFEN